MLKDNLIMLRNIHGYSQEEIAEKIGISRQAYGKLDYSNSAQSLDEWYASPLMRMQTLEALEHTYIDYKASLLQYIEHNT